MFYKMIIGNYLVGVSTVECWCSVSITESEYNNILQVFQNAPIAPDGFGYRLKADTLEWEMVEQPNIEPSADDNEATESDYIEALNTLGVTTNEEN